MNITKNLTDVYKGMYILTRASLVFIIPLFFLHQITKEAIAVGETFNPALMTLLLAGVVTTVMLYQMMRFREK
ncbi:hypothetical protein AMET1_1171 [Methanonatronarchaeum thermophilum]|uniref:Uncharacterized protein n=1 Tax=Methanonatronarchaeum thermophilum TaxID=1927129 RepID=A0A1Y3G9Z5_9EURY|nr:hypothetical protein [Methanonatronarchaeum thermophilum]OUJ18262.1 hypothetical protein AMET1_1171 [Methanonatronarchaeum thermophilum]